MTALPYLEDMERPEGETGMSEVPARAGASLPVSVERFSGTRLRVMVGNGVPECEGNLLSPVREEQQLNCKGICGTGHWFIGSALE
jgi:hypothetical protein